MKKTRMLLSVNDHLFLLEREKELSKEEIEYLTETTECFYDANEWEEKELEHHLSLSSDEVAELIVEMANDLFNMGIELNKMDLELYVSE